MDDPMNTTRDDELKPIAKGPSRRPTKEQGRQGQNIRGMLTVLFVSLALAAVGFVAVFALDGSDEPAPAASTQTTPPAAQQP